MTAVGGGRRLGWGALWVMTSALACAGATPAIETASPQATTRRIALSDGWLAMGTFFEAELRVPEASEARARQWLVDARREIARLERIYSRHDPESELSRWNRQRRQGREGASTPVGPELAEILQHATRLRTATDGAFDVGVGDRVELRTHAEGRTRRPTGATREGALPGGPSAGGTPRVVDLDGLSKGAVLDRLRARFVETLPHGAALLSFGQSSVLAIGAPAEGSWRLRLQSSDPERATLGEVRLRDQALSMSSTRGHVYEVDGVAYSHVIDPATGRPVEGVIESVVVADSALIADAWSTALIVLQRIPQVEETDPYRDYQAMRIGAEGRETRTPGWSAATRRRSP